MMKEVLRSLKLSSTNVEGSQDEYNSCIIYEYFTHLCIYWRSGISRIFHVFSSPQKTSQSVLEDGATD